MNIIEKHMNKNAAKAKENTGLFRFLWLSIFHLFDLVSFEDKVGKKKRSTTENDEDGWDVADGTEGPSKEFDKEVEMESDEEYQDGSCRSWRIIRSSFIVFVFRGQTHCKEKERTERIKWS